MTDADERGHQPRPTGDTNPHGLYLTACDRQYRYPQEDGCSLVLPFALDSGHARRSDLSRLERQDGLLEIRVNPYNDFHPVQLQAVLEIFYWNLERGHWKTDDNRVSGGIDVWREADTAEKWDSYVVPMGAGRYW